MSFFPMPFQLVSWHSEILMILDPEGEKVRDTYISFFVEKKKHDFVQSSPVVPLSDPTLLFANVTCR